MGSGVSAGFSEALKKADQSDLAEVLASVPEDGRQKLRAAVLKTYSQQNDLPITDGYDVVARKAIVVGMAPPATRPDWLPKAGLGQSNVESTHWTLTVAQWIFFVRACKETDTWNAIANAKGEYNINMRDMNTHFVTPWTAGTGSSIALLLNTSETKQAELMLSHSWDGSVVETYNCLQNMVNYMGVPATARMFFCTFSLYQPEDGAAGGLSIGQQIELEPFAKIIKSEPAYGMFVIHTTLSEVYGRLWVAHEADVGLSEGVRMRGLFDIYRWTVDKFKVSQSICTAKAQCGVERDRAFITELIMSRGGFDRLDETITSFRRKMDDELKEFLERAKDVTEQPGSQHDPFITTKVAFDWTYIDEDCCDNPRYEEEQTKWRFADAWTAAVRSVAESFQPAPGIALVPAYDKPNWDAGAEAGKYWGLPLGMESYPLGGPMYRYRP